MKEIVKKYSHAWVFLYFPIYSIWFSSLENNTQLKFTSIHSVLDSFIPFCEIFIIPYLLWFLYVAIIVFMLFAQTDYKTDFYKCFGLLAFGMTIALIIYSFFPSAQYLRPNPMPRYNIFTKIIMHLYSIDTSTNVCPSIHVFNSIATHIAVTHSHYFKNKKKIQKFSLILCILICISTVTLKQHSIVDVFAAILLVSILYPIVYKSNYSTQNEPVTN